MTPVWLALLVVGGCDRADAGTDLRVLFIGNSLTYTNDLPATLEAVARAAGQRIEAVAVTAPNFSLMDHVRGGSEALPMIRRGGWDFVVMQQGPTSFGPGPDRDTLVMSARL